MSSPNDAASFAAEAKAAMDDLLRARAQSGVARNDPLDPLVLALARTINVLGKMPAAIDQQQKTIITASQAMATKAQADMGVSLSATAKTLVNNLGGAVTAREKWKWTALTAVVIGLVAVGSEWLVQTWAVMPELPKCRKSCKKIKHCSQQTFQASKDYLGNNLVILP